METKLPHLQNQHKIETNSNGIGSLWVANCSNDYKLLSDFNSCFRIYGNLYCIQNGKNHFEACPLYSSLHDYNSTNSIIHLLIIPL